ncbi:MAG TPA: hypothetical protein VEA44_10645 [Caulobacter sp.]|nr:hypothetical protein [Caulobacter sp.]
MRGWILAVTAAAILGSAAPAAAHWEWTRWGMTQQEVVAGSGGKAVQGMNGTLKVEEPLKFAGFDFDGVYFGFADGKLDTVTLGASKPLAFEHLEQALAAQFGQPLAVQEGRYRARVFVDKPKGNTITLRSSEGRVSLSYTRLEQRF